MCWQLQVAAQNLAPLSPALVIIGFLPDPNISEEPEFETKFFKAHVQKVSEYDHNFSLGKLYVSSRVFNALHAFVI